MRFVKYYDSLEGGYDAVRYSGSVTADGNEITGRWEIRSDWSGTFIMTRETGVDAVAEHEAETETAAPGGVC